MLVDPTMEMTDRLGRTVPHRHGRRDHDEIRVPEVQRTEAMHSHLFLRTNRGDHAPHGSDHDKNDRRNRNDTDVDARFEAANPLSQEDDIPATPAVAADVDEDDIVPAQDKSSSRLSGRRRRRRRHRQRVLAEMAGMAGNVLEWYDFAVFGYLSDVIGQVFFPSEQASGGTGMGGAEGLDPHHFLSDNVNATHYAETNVSDPPNDNSHTNTLYAFAVFGGAFWMRPVGGLLLGYWGDTRGTKAALVLSIFLMAFPTFALGCLPTYEQVGYGATVLLVVVRMVQGLSVGGQLVTSIVFTLEGHPREQWGYRGSCVMATANVGSLLGSLVGYALRAFLSHSQLLSWGWRVRLFGMEVLTPRVSLRNRPAPLSQY
jgi:Sugar (and other) transporter